MQSHAVDQSYRRGSHEPSTGALTSIVSAMTAADGTRAANRRLGDPYTRTPERHLGRPGVSKYELNQSTLSNLGRETNCTMT